MDFFLAHYSYCASSLGDVIFHVCFVYRVLQSLVFMPPRLPALCVCATIQVNGERDFLLNAAAVVKMM